MVLLLPLDVLPRRRNAGLSKRKRPVTRLSRESRQLRSLCLEPLRRTLFHLLDHVAQRHGSSQQEQRVNMIRRAVDDDGGTVHRLEHGRLVGVQIRVDGRRQLRLAVFGAVNQMDQDRRQGLRHGRSRPDDGNHPQTLADEISPLWPVVATNNLVSLHATAVLRKRQGPTRRRPERAGVRSPGRRPVPVRFRANLSQRKCWPGGSGRPHGSKAPSGLCLRLRQGQQPASPEPRKGRAAVSLLTLCSICTICSIFTSPPLCGWSVAPHDSHDSHFSLFCRPPVGARLSVYLVSLPFCCCPRSTAR
jgi:hypothetical protein